MLGWGYQILSLIHISGGRKLLVGNLELFLLSGRLYYEENDELKEFINDQNYRLDSLNLSGNWIYGLGYFEGMHSIKSPANYLSAPLIRYNILTKK